MTYDRDYLDTLDHDQWVSYREHKEANWFNFIMGGCIGTVTTVAVELAFAYFAGWF